MISLVLVISPKPFVYAFAEGYGLVGFRTMQTVNRDNRAIMGPYAASKLPKFARLCFTDGQKSGVVDNELEINGPTLMELLTLHCRQRGMFDQSIDAEAVLKHYLEGSSLNCAMNYLCEVVPRIAEPAYDQKFDKPRGSLTAWTVANEMKTLPDFWRLLVAPDTTVTVEKRRRGSASYTL